MVSFIAPYAASSSETTSTNSSACSTVSALNKGISSSVSGVNAFHSEIRSFTFAINVSIKARSSSVLSSTPSNESNCDISDNVLSPKNSISSSPQPSIVFNESNPNLSMFSSEASTAPDTNASVAVVTNEPPLWVIASISGCGTPSPKNVFSTTVTASSTCAWRLSSKAARFPAAVSSPTYSKFPKRKSYSSAHQ